MGDLIQDFLSIPFKYNGNNTQFRPGHKAIIQKLYHQVFRKQVPRKGNCKSCLVDAAVELKMYFKNNHSNIVQLNPIVMSKFSIKKGKVVSFQGFPYSLTSANCTDEKAIAFLRRAKERGVNPEKLIGHFAGYPDNWKELVNGSAEVETTPAPIVEPSPVDNGNDAGNDDGNSGADVIEKTREMLNGKSKKELQKDCSEFGLPEEEWESLSKKDLIEYMIKKV